VFWTYAAGALLIAALITFRPLLRGKSLWQPLALALIFALPAGALWLYTQVGAPEAISLDPPRRSAAAEHATDAQDMEAVVQQLRSRLSESADDLDGWMLLARTLKTMQRYDEAMSALETANALSPDNPPVMVELAEAMMFASGNSTVSAESTALLRRALDLDPGQQKAMWLLGIAAAQSGDYESAVTYWETLLETVEPGSAVAQSVQSQVDEARNRMGMSAEASVPEPAEPEPPAEPERWAGIPLRLTAPQQLPDGVLYVIIRPAGMTMGPPIGVRRVQNPVFPLEMTISDADSMMKERLVSSESELQLQARLSRTGSPTTSPGDWQSEAIVVALDTGEPVELSINQLVE
jgi:cytochrome c-type biogenesis protein CcmH